MVTVSEAEKIIMGECRSYGTEQVPLEQSIGRVLAEDICADRDLPPCDRSTLDGIAIRFAAIENGIDELIVKGIVAAGVDPGALKSERDCMEIMTGAALPEGADTVIRYEDVAIRDGRAKLLITKIRKGQSIHPRGKDKQKGDVVVNAHQLIDPTLISMATSVGKTSLEVFRHPRIVMISTGNEMVDIHEQPTAFQLRRSNGYTVRAILQETGIHADLLHLQDEQEATRQLVSECIRNYDVILLSGGVSMGKFDFVPGVLELAGVQKLFHKVKQRPGKPFWFGSHPNGALIFAFPGNPVSTFMCVYRYLVPWLKQACGLADERLNKPACAVLAGDITFEPPLQYFAQVKLEPDNKGQIAAIPVEGNGSGDFANLLASDAFIELPELKSIFKAGDVYRVWPYKKII